MCVTKPDVEGRTQRSQRFIFGAVLSNDSPYSPMSVDTNENIVADVNSSPATSTMTDGVTTQLSEPTAHTKHVTDNNSSSATTDATYVVTAPTSEHSLPAQLMSTPVSLLSVVSRE